MASETIADSEAPSRASVFVRDVLALSKPRITGMVLFTFTGGLLLAPGAVVVGKALVALLGTTLIVAAANAINMYLERDVDGLMRRTMGRPLPDGRVAPFVALALGAMLASAAVPTLLVGGGAWLCLLGVIAFYSYVWGYTPLKRRSPLSLYVGAVPGAMPPLMGWVTATGRPEAPGLALFALMFVWQIPHFIAIAIFRAEDYAGAGFRVISLARSPLGTRVTLLLSTVALLPATLSLVWLGIAGWLYGAAALVLGLGFLVSVGRGLRLGPHAAETRIWAKSVFIYSLLYLTVLFVALALDRVLLAS